MARAPELPTGNGKALDADYAALSDQIASLKADLANITGTLFEGWAGPVKIAAGIEYPIVPMPPEVMNLPPSFIV